MCTVLNYEDEEEEEEDEEANSVQRKLVISNGRCLECSYHQQHLGLCASMEDVCACLCVYECSILQKNNLKEFTKF